MDLRGRSTLTPAYDPRDSRTAQATSDIDWCHRKMIIHSDHPAFIARLIRLTRATRNS